MKRYFLWIVAGILALSLTACSDGLDQELLDSSKPPVAATEEKPSEPDAPAAEPETPAEEAPTEKPEPEEEAPVTLQPPVNNDLTGDTHGLQCVMGEVTGYYDEIVSYSLQQPEFSGLGTTAADETVNQLYAGLVEGMAGYAYKVVYPAAQERHTGADVTGVCEVVEANGQILEVRYTLTTHFGDSDEDRVEVRTDYFDWMTGEKTSGER